MSDIDFTPPKPLLRIFFTNIHCHPQISDYILDPLQLERGENAGCCIFLRKLFTSIEEFQVQEKLNNEQTEETFQPRFRMKEKVL